jgi:hypothetical protein
MLYGSTNSLAVLLTVNPIPSCDPAPSGLVSWWPGEGNASDGIGGNNGVVETGTTFTAGMVGQCFSFDGVSGCVMTTNTPPLTNIQNTFTMEFWAYPQKDITLPTQGDDNGYPGTSGQSYAVFPDWGGTGGPAGAGVSVGMNGIAVIEQADGYVPSLLTYANSLNGWVHVAVVYSNKQPTLYVNGVDVATGLTSTRTFVYPSKNLGGNTLPPWQSYGPYQGLLDEVSIYNRALSAAEVAAIYNAGSGGKCPVPITIISQPVSQTNLVGTTATFSVGASGTGPLSYQWFFGASPLSQQTNSTLVLSNVQPGQAGNYSVAVTNLYGATNSVSATLALVLPPLITQQPQSQTVLSFSSASFTVAASGTGPLSYHWRKGGTNLVDGGNVSGSATTNLILAIVGLGDAGNYDVVVGNPYSTTNSAIAVLTVPQTGMTLGSVSAMSGSSVVVPVLMNALGVESTFLATVGYDPTKLALQNVQLGAATAGAYLQEVDTRTNIGLVGFAVLGSTVPAGTNQQVALVNFQALPVTSNTTVSLFFTNYPTLQQIYDNNFDLLPAIYAGGTVTLLPAEYEADVYPRTNGDHQVTVLDWLEEGRMVAGLDAPLSSDEMLRADCAPRNAPDGVLTVADWVQAGRYALGLDPLTLVPLPAEPGIKSLPISGAMPPGGLIASRTLQIGNVTAQRGQTVSVPVQFVCTTNENAVGLTVSFDPNQLQLTGITLGSAMTGGRTNINYSQPGKLGLVIALPPGASLVAGTNQLLVLQFTTSTNASGLAVLSLDNSVAVLQVADKTANSLAANYVNGSVSLPPQPVLTTAVAGANLQLTWPVSTGTFQVQSANNPLGPWTNSTLPLTTNGANATVTVTATNQQQYFRLQGQ